jgi:hypothetical protein
MPTTTFGLPELVIFEELGVTIKKCENTDIVSSSHIVKVSVKLWPKGYTGDWAG